jgi:glycosyltransferase involved in cell wall biosynthesis
MTGPLFTVLTATFNRAHTLPRVYDSLCRQTFRDFEWVIVDDGSTDDTASLVARWQAEGKITVRYFRQMNAGKHVAFNRGVREAEGELLLTLDSDDTVLPSALTDLATAWNDIPSSERERFSGVTGLCVDEQGHVIGPAFPASPLDTSPLDMMARPGAYVNERWGFHRTALLRAHPYPEIAGESFIAEGLIWNRLADRYLIRFTNTPLRVYRYEPDGLSAQSLAIRARSPQGCILFYGEYACLARSARERVRARINLARFAKHAGMSLWRQSVLLIRAGARGGLPAYLVTGFASWLVDRRALGRTPSR